MKIAIMQPYFLPYLPYFQLMNAVDTFVIYDDVQFIKNGWINRNRILVNNDPHTFTIPLRKSSTFDKINQKELIEDRHDIRKIIKTIEENYSKKIYFNQFLIKSLFRSQNTLIDLIINSFKIISDHSGITTKLILSSELSKNNDLKGQDKVINICKNLGCTDYINSVGGQTLYDKKTFKKNGIVLHFLKNCAKDKNINLSILHNLLSFSKEELKELLKDFILI